MEVLEIRTTKRVEVVDITDKVEKLAGGEAVLVYTPHTTTAIVLNEAESGLLKDLLNFLEKLVPSGEYYEHNRIDDNADAHIRASILGNSVLIPVFNGKLALGTWQRILFLEFDGPRSRKIFIKKL
ncbi:MAG: secondary thiamine-phosphate synthase enzyme YjbQ [Archaeoglobaceae archaeon]|nr:secondary thiamine-phosphate synthase enzyme YjbQ [Archaeoglobaceae archaeon]MCX8151662.1 secondary thiamine-phosphate synthase enzyme YjbQ [Archaeoglobaceae archaeon]MDW8013060.1 secondary thiamine-phosphate synthase enzyme YjbQ [Archaeoglobaceae archaeon]